MLKSERLENKEKKQTPEQESGLMGRVFVGSIFFSFLMFGIKFMAYRFTDSVALYSDAMESVVNLLTALISWWLLSLSMKPADGDHPFGHYKAEYFSSVLEGIFILIAALSIFQESFFALRTPRLVFNQQLSIGIYLSGLAAFLNALWAWYLYKQAQKSNSSGLYASSMHWITDVITTLSLVLGLSIIFFTGYTQLDAFLGFLVALYIVWQGWKIINFSIQGLMDIGVKGERVQQIKDVISANAAGALEVHDFKSRQAGRVIFVEFDLVLPSLMSVGDAHEICDRIESALEQQIGMIRVVIHVEPEAEAKLQKRVNLVPFA